MIVSDRKRIIETASEEEVERYLDLAVIGWCDTVGSFICYVETEQLEQMPVIKEIEVAENERWDEDDI